MNQSLGKIMSISDSLMWKYYSILLVKEQSEISQMQESVASSNTNPMELKKQLAQKLIEKYWSKCDAISALKNFEAVFQKKDYSKIKEIALPKNTDNPIWIVDLLKILNSVKSSSDAKRLIENNAIEINGKKLNNFKEKISWKENLIIKVGKYKIFKIKNKPYID